MRTIVIAIILVAILGLYYKLDSLVGYFSMSKTQVLANDSKIEKKMSLTGKNTLIAYFSWGGNTRGIAHYIQDEIGGDLYEITTKDNNHYPKDYNSTVEVGAREVKDNIYPEINTFPGNIQDYDIIILGYPIWWHAAPMAVQAFLKNYDFSGKTILPFATSGGDDVSLTIDSVKKYLPNSTVKDGLTANIKSRIKSWLLKNKIFE